MILIGAERTEVIEPAQGKVSALSPAPMAVLPDFQNRSIGSQLVRAGSTKRPTQSLPVPDASFMACELEPGALDGIQGRIELPQAFDDAI